jgi:hypothetical protein
MSLVAPGATRGRSHAATTLAELEASAARLSIAVSYEALQTVVGGGGLCRVKGAYRIIIDKRASIGERATTLAAALAQVGVDADALSPRARDLVAVHRVRRAS